MSNNHWMQINWADDGIAGGKDIFYSENTEQYAVIFDLISEGEIHGLINGPSSIYLNSTPMLDEGIWDITGPKSTKLASLDLSNATRITVATSEEFFDNRIIDSTKHQYILLQGAGKSTTSSGGVTFSGSNGIANPVGPRDNEAQTLITASASFFTEGMVNVDEPYTPMIAIEGAGHRGTTWFGHLISFVSATQA